MVDYATKEQIEISDLEKAQWDMRVGDSYFAHIKECYSLPMEAMCFDIERVASRKVTIYYYVVPIAELDNRL